MSEYTGHVDPGGEPATRTLEHLTHHQDCRSGRWTTTPTCWSAAHTGDGLLIDAANDSERIADLLDFGPDPAPAAHHRDDPPAPGPLAGARRDRRSDRGEPGRPPRRRGRAAGAHGCLPGAGNPVHGGRRSHRVHPSPRPYPRLAGGALPRSGRLAAPVHRRFTVSRWTRQDQAPRPTSRRCSTTSKRGCSTSFPTTPGSIPGHGDDTTLGRERPHLAEWRNRGW